MTAGSGDRDAEERHSRPGDIPLQSGSIRVRSVPEPPAETAPSRPSDSGEPEFEVEVDSTPHEPPVPEVPSMVVALPHRKSERFAPTLELPKVTLPPTHRPRKSGPWGPTVAALGVLVCVVLCLPAVRSKLFTPRPTPLRLEVGQPAPLSDNGDVARYSSKPVASKARSKPRLKKRNRQAARSRKARRLRAKRLRARRLRASRRTAKGRRTRRRR